MKDDKMIRELKQIFKGVPEGSLYNELEEKSKIEFLKIDKRELEIFRMRLIDNYTYETIGEKLGICSIRVVRLVDRVLYNKLPKLRYLNANGVKILIDYGCDIRTINALLRSMVMEPNESIEDLVRVYNLINDNLERVSGVGPAMIKKLGVIIHNICKDYNLDPNLRFPNPINYDSDMIDVCERYKVGKRLINVLLDKSRFNGLNPNNHSKNVDKIIELYYLYNNNQLYIFRNDKRLKKEWDDLMTKLETEHDIKWSERLKELKLVSECKFNVNILCNKDTCERCQEYKEHNIV